MQNPVGSVCAQSHQQPGWGCESWTQNNRFDHYGFCKAFKAFDKVPYRRLLHKLDYYGIRGSGPPINGSTRGSLGAPNK